MGVEFDVGDPEDVRLKEKARRLLAGWRDPLDLRPSDPGETDDFDYEASDERGLAAAKEVKLSLGENVYVEFKPFREISLVDGEAVQKEVPERILELSGTSV